jgi:hypothetical protein
MVNKKSDRDLSDYLILSEFDIRSAEKARLLRESIIFAKSQMRVNGLRHARKPRQEPVIKYMIKTLKDSYHLTDCDISILLDNAEKYTKAQMSILTLPANTPDDIHVTKCLIMQIMYVSYLSNTLINYRQELNGYLAQGGSADDFYKPPQTSNTTKFIDYLSSGQNMMQPREWTHDYLKKLKA